MNKFIIALAATAAIVTGAVIFHSETSNARTAASTQTITQVMNKTITCGATPTVIDTVGLSLYCDNNSATSIFIGGPAVTTSDLCISKEAANCPRRDLPADFAGSAAYCLVASGTATLKCVAGY